MVLRSFIFGEWFIFLSIYLIHQSFGLQSFWWEICWYEAFLVCDNTLPCWLRLQESLFPFDKQTSLGAFKFIQLLIAFRKCRAIFLQLKSMLLSLSFFFQNSCSVHNGFLDGVPGSRRCYSHFLTLHSFCLSFLTISITISSLVIVLLSLAIWTSSGLSWLTVLGVWPSRIKATADPVSDVGLCKHMCDFFALCPPMTAGWNVSLGPLLWEH